ncbi:peptide chain release factor N(5)-glutamine methyltransferase [Ruania suaedae]|uniref:peptide chain release factor N(5)-glutamine methyltransferase n=1 Tax=Ruania suaedae TaxID=2897774 RepID=UPI001E31924C|nr:peptide chain release factor N(5)-glutamine methyltransferase [Ruania suaedae]UFU02142.1 peptide chain release factor N(5)-glutamine methyltransferase [Ruania suaedae]
MVRAATAVLAEAGVASPQADALALAEHVLGLERLVLATAPEPPADFPGRYAQAVDRRRRRVPLQHITGAAHFRYLRLEVGPGVFVPRPETEVVAGAAIEEACTRARPVVVDLCAGSGAIALSVAREVHAAVVTAVELGAEPVATIEANARRLGLSVRVVRADATEPGTLRELDGRVDVVVANPPYIPPDAVPVDPEVRDHDPDLALYGGGSDGLEIPRGVLGRGIALLRSGGLLVMEHAEVQAAAVRALARESGALEEISTGVDLTGRDRMLVARRR